MLNNYLPLVINYHQTLGVLYLIYSGLKLNFLTTNLMDLYTRVVANEFYWNLYYYSWTTYWYIPITLLSLTFYFLKKINYYTNPTYYIQLILLFLLVHWDLIDYLNLNINYYNHLNRFNNYNVLLTNSINKYHPGMLYLSVLYLFYVSYCKLNYKFIYSHRYFPNLPNYIFLTYLPTNIVLLAATLFLGSWWAYQEGSWGGWWNWDPSEVFGLVFFIIFVYYLHNYPGTLNLYIPTVNIFFYTYISTLIYILLQVNFDNISHSFGIKSTYFIKPLLLYTVSLYLILLVASIYLIHTYIIFQNFVHCRGITGLSTPTTRRHNKPVNYYLFTICLLSQVLISLIPLLINFYTKSNLLTYDSIFNAIYYINYIYIYFILVVLWVFNTKNILNGVYCFTYPTPYLPPYMFYRMFIKNNLNLLHILILLFLFIATISTYYMINFQVFNLHTFSINPQGQKYYYTYNSLTIDTILIRPQENYLYSLNLNSISNIFLKATTPEIHNFIFHLTSILQVQVLLLGNLVKHYAIGSWDLYTHIIFMLWIILTALFSNYIKSKLKFFI